MTALATSPSGSRTLGRRDCQQPMAQVAQRQIAARSAAGDECGEGFAQDGEVHRGAIRAAIPWGKAPATKDLRLGAFPVMDATRGAFPTGRE